ncbi:hypothetical protein E2C01_018093 [Portunus trituberculatus]|uniref:Uncharacterized protein n=1 Tax=Portunus trituberculatus TaxID=210409 RepID=A0A5B7DV92_PORTR|nr:hypothetical protein [Portunus trituberculatus]
MLWTWDKTDAVVLCGLVSAVLTGAAHAVISTCCWSSFFILWGALAALYIISAFPQFTTLKSQYKISKSTERKERREFKNVPVSSLYNV